MSENTSIQDTSIPALSSEQLDELAKRVFALQTEKANKAKPPKKSEKLIRIGNVLESNSVEMIRISLQESDLFNEKIDVAKVKSAQYLTAAALYFNNQFDRADLVEVLNGLGFDISIGGAGEQCRDWIVRGWAIDTNCDGVAYKPRLSNHIVLMVAQHVGLARMQEILAMED